MIAASLALIGGILIYLLFRSPSIRINIWASSLLGPDLMIESRAAFGHWHLPDFVKYSLPDGLYCLSYILFIDSIWKDNNKSYRIPVASLIPCVALLHESFQGLGLISGTFDWIDLLTYACPLAIYIFWNYRNILKFYN